MTDLDQALEESRALRARVRADRARDLAQRERFEWIKLAAATSWWIVVLVHGATAPPDALWFTIGGLSASVMIALMLALLTYWRAR